MLTTSGPKRASPAVVLIFSCKPLRKMLGWDKPGLPILSGKQMFPQKLFYQIFPPISLAKTVFHGYRQQEGKLEKGISMIMIGLPRWLKW